MKTVQDYFQSNAGFQWAAFIVAWGVLLVGLSFGISWFGEEVLGCTVNEGGVPPCEVLGVDIAHSLASVVVATMLFGMIGVPLFLLALAAGVVQLVNQVRKDR